MSGSADRSTNWRRYGRLAARAVFGDRTGVVVFLAGLVVVSAYWRIGVFISDSYAVGNALANLADGHLSITKLVYSINYGSQPGLVAVDGAVYGRNYGHVVVSLPVLWLFETLTVVVDPRLVLAAGWSVLVLLLFEQTGRVVGQSARWSRIGGVVALLAFVGNAAVATPVAPKWFPFVALQVTTMVAAALVGVVLYRLLSAFHGARVGGVIGLVAIVATPLGFWASIPKRHVFTALAAVGMVTAFYFARTVESGRTGLVARALSYGIVGLTTWMHPGEALVLFLALAPIDLVTARSNHPRRLAVVAGVFLLALTPFLVTNYAISGNPFAPPRTLPQAPAQPDSVDQALESIVPRRTSERTAPALPTPGGPQYPLVLSVVTLFSGVFELALRGLQRVIEPFATSVEAVGREPARLYYTFVRSGRIPAFDFYTLEYAVNRQEAIELTLLETTPVLATLAGGLGVAGRRLRSSSVRTIRTGLGRPERQTDVLALAVAVLFCLLYLARLPFHSQITVRYLLPVGVLGLYGVGRLGAVHRALRVDWRLVAGAYGSVVLVSLGGVTAVVLWLDLAIGEAMQLHALLGLASAAVVSVWAIVESLGVEIDSRVGTVAIAVPVGLTTVFLLVTGFVYFQYADYALPVAQTFTELLPVSV